mmetsp:Transcript_46865/g.100925  ORF Transcript_46865/g.100925 Transcript_46865/m.100925 type:complete len:218 (+) Transcript_46865:1160-1813(+)
MVLQIAKASSRRVSLEAATRLARPAARACSAVRSRPVKSMSAAVFRFAALVTATEGVPQKKPILTPGVPNRAPGAATTMSQLAANWQPAAKAHPCTAATVGTGHRTTIFITSEQSKNICSLYSLEAISARLCPAPKCFPAAERRTTDTSFTFSGAKCFFSIESMSELRALRFSGVFMCKCSTRPSLFANKSGMMRGSAGNKRELVVSKQWLAHKNDT